MADATGLTVKVVDEPLSCVARGTAVYLDNLTDWRNTMETDHENM
jgi:rod shape-determining protein MreB